MTTERRKLLSLIFIAFLVLVLPIALLLSRQRQEIRKKASDVSGLQVGNLRVSPTTITVGQTINVYVEGTGSDAYGYIEGKVIYDSNYFEPVTPNQVWTPLAGAHRFVADSSVFIFGANNKSSLLTGQILKLTLRAKQAGSTSITLGEIAPSHPAKGILLNGSQSLFGSGTSGISVAITAAATSTPTPTPTTTPTPTPTLAPNTASIDLGSPIRNGTQVSFPININAYTNPYQAKVILHYYPSELTYVSAAKSGLINTFTASANSSGSNSWVTIDASGFTGKTGQLGTVNFTLNPSATKADLWMVKSEIPDQVYLTKSAGVKFATINCSPSTGANCLARYSMSTPTATAVVTATPTATPVTGTPTATPTPTQVSTPTPTPTQTVAPSPIISNVTAVALSSTRIKIEWDTNTPTTSFVAYSDVDANFGGADPASWGRWRYNIDNVLVTDMKTHHVMEIGALIPNTLYYYRIAGRDYPGGGRLTVMVGVGSVRTLIASPTPTATAGVGGIAGDTNGNGCVGACDTSYVINHLSQSPCLPNAVAITPTAASNGDFNHDGCVDDLDINTVVVNGSLCANDCSQ